MEFIGAANESDQQQDKQGVQFWPKPFEAEGEGGKDAGVCQFVPRGIEQVG